MKKLLIICFFIQSFGLLASEGKWELIDTLRVKGTTSYYQTAYQALKCADSRHCAAGANVALTRPYCRYTSDGGNTWSNVLIDTAKPPYKMYDLAFPDTSLCIIVCEKGYYWISRDNCKTWEQKNIDTTGKLLNRCDFYDNQFGAVLGRHIYVTSDGARTWSKFENNDSDSIGVFALHVPETDVVYVVAYSYYTKKDFLIYTHDGGRTWGETPGFEPRIRWIWFWDKYRGIAVGARPKEQYSPNRDDVILKTTDGGMTWATKLDTYIKPTSGVSKVYFKDENNGIAIGLTGNKIWRTSDAGETWQYDTSAWHAFYVGWLSDVAYLNGDTLLGCDDVYGQIIKYIPGPTSSISVEPMFEVQHLTISPNPLHRGEALRVSFILPSAGTARAEIYNTLGALAVEPYSGVLPEGENTLRFTPEGALPSGGYYLRLTLNRRQIGSAKFIVR